MKKTNIIYTLTIITILLTGCAANSMPQNEQPTVPNGTIAPSPAAPSETNTISEDDAKRIALEKVPGATTDNVRRLKTEYDNGRLVYDGEIYFERYEYDFEIDAQNGSILEWDAEPIYDGVM